MALIRRREPPHVIGREGRNDALVRARHRYPLYRILWYNTFGAQETQKGLDGAGVTMDGGILQAAPL